MKRLASKYFEFLSQGRIGDTDEVAQAYVCKHPEATSILYPKQDPTRPVCAVTIVPLDQAHRSIFTKRAGEPGRFQVLFDGSGIPFKIVLTNLTHFGGRRDFVKVDLLQDDVAVDWTDNDKLGINQLNEIHASQSCVVKADQRFGNRQLLVRGISKADGTALTVREDESSSSSPPRADRFYVNVVADAQLPEIVSLLTGGTFWRPAEQFVRVIVDPKPRSTSKGGGFLECSSMSDDDEDPSPPMRYRGGGYASVSAGRGVGAFNESGSFPLPEEKGRTMVDATTDDVMGSQAGKLGHGDFVSVRTGNTYAEYAFDAPGERMTFGISVLPSLALFDKLPRVAALALGNEEIEKTIKGYVAKMLETLAVFAEKDCVACLSESATEIAIRCGHRCACGTCARALREKKLACPMCRASVIGYINADAGF